MNSLKKSCVQLIRVCCNRQIGRTNYHLFLTSSESQTKLISRSLLTRPKALDELRQKEKERRKKDEYEDKSTSEFDEITPLGYFLIVS